MIASHFTFRELPKLSDIFPKKNLYIDNLARHMESTDPKEYLIKFYVHINPPESYLFLGNIQQSEIEKELPATNIGDWENLRNQW